jgi:uncharacterized protein (TIRG00374 family)
VEDTAVLPTRTHRWSFGRVAFLVATGVCLYIFAPSIAEVFEAWGRLGEVHPAALVAVVALEGLSFVCIWILQRTTLRTTEWYSVAMSQLAGNAFNRITPGGGATGAALQARLLSDAGFSGTTAASALATESILISAVVVAMPLLALPAIILAGTAVPGNLADGLWIGAGVCAVLVGILALLFGGRRVVAWLGTTIQRLVNVRRLRRGQPLLVGLGDRLLDERDEIRQSLGAHWIQALGAAVGRWGFEYFALLVTLYAIGASPDIWLVFLAFIVASVLSMIPLTPGGLGFVEAGLAGTLAIAGIGGGKAVLATLVFRLASFWLPMPVGAVAAVLFRRRYPRRNRFPGSDEDDDDSDDSDAGTLDAELGRFDATRRIP